MDEALATVECTCQHCVYHRQPKRFQPNAGHKIELEGLVLYERLSDSEIVKKLSTKWQCTPNSVRKLLREYWEGVAAEHAHNRPQRQVRFLARCEKALEAAELDREHGAVGKFLDLIGKTEGVFEQPTQQHEHAHTIHTGTLDQDTLAERLRELCETHSDKVLSLIPTDRIHAYIESLNQPLLED